MKLQNIVFGLLFTMCMSSSFAMEQELQSAKDTFGRSNKRNRNNGASENLYIAHAPNIRTLITFDLTGTTNEIVGAEFRFHQHNSMPDPISMTISAMVNTPNNAAWGEGTGNLGSQGQNARAGEACYAFSAFRNVPWEAPSGAPVANLADAQLWNPAIATLQNLDWNQGTWVVVPINDISWLEKIRKSDTPMATFGLWGSAGKGLYSISSNNTPWPPVLRLQLKEVR